MFDSLTFQDQFTTLQPGDEIFTTKISGGNLFFVSIRRNGESVLFRGLFDRKSIDREEFGKMLEEIKNKHQHTVSDGMAANFEECRATKYKVLAH